MLFAVPSAVAKMKSPLYTNMLLLYKISIHPYRMACLLQLMQYNYSLPVRQPTSKSFSLFAMSSKQVQPAEPPASPIDYETEHVHTVYDSIASHFSSTRYKPWPVVAAFLSSIPAGWVGLDLGTGNGKYLHLPVDRPGQIWTIGLDRSIKLLEIAKNAGGKEKECIHGDALGLCWREGAFVSKIAWCYSSCVPTLHKIGLCYIYRNHPPSIYPGAEKKSYPGEEVECVLFVFFVAKSSFPHFSVCYGACLLLMGEVSSMSGLRSKTTYQNELYPEQKASQSQTLKKDKTFSCRGL